MAGFREKLIKQREKVVSEDLDYTPIAIISGTKQPETLSQAVARILDHSLSEEEWERVRGAEYDMVDEDSIDNDSYQGDFESGELEHDTKGHYEEDYKKEQAKRKVKNDEKKASNVDNSDRGDSNSDSGSNNTIELKADNETE